MKEKLISSNQQQEQKSLFSNDLVKNALLLKKAILIGTYQGRKNKDTCEEHLKELGLLANTFGLESLLYMLCPTQTYDSSTFIGKGKLEEINKTFEDFNPDILIFDDEILPSQQRNLEKYYQRPVIDRTELILAIFAQRARSHEARLQIELAQAKYQLPRLKRMWTHLSRQRGGGAYLKGEGEKQIEIDKRLLKQRISKLQKDLENVQANRKTQRSARTKSKIPIFAIIGYTNAGKSTLLKALTDADVFVEDKLFATLDTTTRKFTLPNNQDILLIDTVGFIRKIPHTLVAAFKSTLEESIEADILLHMIDISHPMAEEQAESTYAVLKELKGDQKPIITILNKIDICTNMLIVNKLRIKYPKTIQISSTTKQGIDDLIELMISSISEQRKTVKLSIPQNKYELIGQINSIGKILNQYYEDNDIIVHAEIPTQFVHHFKEYII